MKSANAMLQVIEWFDTAQVGTNGLITASGAETAGADGNSPIAESATTYASGGVFFNPITDKGEATAGITNGVFAWNTIASQNNAALSEANSLGAALYYDRSTGQGKNTVKVVDSTWATRVFEPYTAVTTKFDADKSTYDTAKTDYETAFTANAKDNKTTVPTRPDMPSVPAAYSGPSLLLSDQVGSSVTSWDTGATSVKLGKTGTEMVLATGGSIASPTYSAAAIATHFHNRYAYYQLSNAYTNTYTPTLATDEVAAAFGRLGQSKLMDNTSGTPFLWASSSQAATQKPGMQISILPEFVSGTRTDWGTGDNAVINCVTKTFASVSDFESPTTPTAATAISVGAQALAASLIASAAVASTLF